MPRAGRLLSLHGTNAKIWLNRTKELKHISGRYSVHFGRQHLEGQFVVKCRRRRAHRSFANEGVRSASANAVLKDATFLDEVLPSDLTT